MYNLNPVINFFEIYHGKDDVMPYKNTKDFDKKVNTIQSRLVKFGI